MIKGIDIKVSKDEIDIGWYLLDFLNAFREKYNIPLKNWIRLVKEQKLAIRFVETFDCIQEMIPEDYATLLLEYLENKGVNINEYK